MNFREWRSAVGLPGDTLPTVKDLSYAGVGSVDDIRESQLMSWEPLEGEDLTNNIDSPLPGFLYGVLWASVGVRTQRHRTLRFGLFKFNIRRFGTDTSLLTPFVVSRYKDHKYWSWGVDGQNTGRHTPGFKVEGFESDYRKEQRRAQMVMDPNTGFRYSRGIQKTA